MLASPRETDPILDPNISSEVAFDRLLGRKPLQRDSSDDYSQSPHQIAQMDEYAKKVRRGSVLVQLTLFGETPPKRPDLPTSASVRRLFPTQSDAIVVDLSIKLAKQKVDSEEIVLLDELWESLRAGPQNPCQPFSSKTLDCKFPIQPDIVWKAGDRIYYDLRKTKAKKPYPEQPQPLLTSPEQAERYLTRIQD